MLNEYGIKELNTIKVKKIDKHLLFSSLIYRAYFSPDLEKMSSKDFAKHTEGLTVKEIKAVKKLQKDLLC